MAIDFPTSPTPNQLHTAGSRSWTWNNSVGAWYAVNAGVQGIQGIQGTQGTQGLQGITGSQGTQGTQGIQGIQGVQGIQGLTGLAFTIAKTYLSVAALNADTAPTAIVAGQFALINTTNVEDAENSRLYIWTGSTYTFVDDLSGSAGIQGITGSQGVQGIQGIQGITGTQGAIGSQGAQGTQGLQGIQGISGASILGTNNTFTGTNAFGTFSGTGFGVNTTPTSSGTGTTYARWLNTGNDFYAGIESSVAGSFFPGSSAYASVLYSSQPIQFIISGTKRAEIDSTGASLIGNLTLSNDQTERFIKSSANGGAIRLRGNSAAGTDRNVQLGQVDNNGTWMGAYLTAADGGNVGIGTTSPASKLSVAGAMDATYPNLVGHVNIFSTDSMAIDKGGVLSLSGSFTGTTMTTFASLYGRKENATDGNYAGYLAFLTRGVSDTGTEKMRITSTGSVGIGVTSPDQPLAFADSLGVKIQFNGSNANGYQIGLGSSVNSGDAMMKFTAGENGAGEFGFYTTTNLRMLINNAGNVGIGTSAPAYKLDVNGPGAFYSDSGARVLYLKQQAVDSGNIIQFLNQSGSQIWELVGRNNQFYIYNTAVSNYSIYVAPATNYVGIGTGSPSYKLHVAGDIYASGTITEASSISLKENLNPITDALNVISNLKGWIYDRKDGSAMNQAGFIAEEVEQVLPNVVSKTEDGTPMGVQYTKIIAYLVESVKELKSQIEAMKGNNG